MSPEEVELELEVEEDYEDLDMADEADLEADTTFRPHTIPIVIDRFGKRTRKKILVVCRQLTWVEENNLVQKHTRTRRGRGSKEVTNLDTVGYLRTALARIVKGEECRPKLTSDLIDRMAGDQLKQIGRYLGLMREDDDKEDDRLGESEQRPDKGTEAKR